jgi:pSer/pThr/pTyr-binding forkhead associated (FHA) protein
MWILQTDPSAAGRATFRMPVGAVKTIGRSAGAEFMLDAPLVSRLHCQLSATPDALEVKDLGSTNGTFVNDKRIKSAKLRVGDRLKVGRVELKVSNLQADI